MTITGTQIIGLLAGVALLAGCSGVEPDDDYESAEELSEVLDSEGFRCSAQASFDVFEGYGEEIRCGSGMSILVWDDDTPEYAGDISLLRLGTALGGRESLTSDSWMIIHDNAQMLDEIHEVFGGERQSPSR